MGKNNANNRRFDDIEIRSKLELLAELQAHQVELEKQNCELIDTQQQLREMMNYNHELLRGNRRLMRNIFKIQEEERRLLARELHDELGQWLTAIHAETQTIFNCADKASPIQTSAKAISECVRRMHTVAHNMLYHLRPPLLDILGLVGALHELKKQWCIHHAEISIELKLEGELGMLGENINITIYRIVQEALNNIGSHARANRVLISLICKMDKLSTNNFLLLNVKDDGVGYNADEITSGFGLLGMRERAIAAGGEFAICSVPNDGTQVDVKLPIISSNKNRRVNDF